MLSLLGSIGTHALKTFIPAAINWGMNKLSNSNGLGKTVIAPAIAGAFQPQVPQPSPTPRVTFADSPQTKESDDWIDQEAPKKKNKVKGILKKRKGRR